MASQQSRAPWADYTTGTLTGHLFCPYSASVLNTSIGLTSTASRLPVIG